MRLRENVRSASAVDLLAADQLGEQVQLLRADPQSRVSPQKLNLLAQLIRGKKVDRALADLTFSRKRIAKDVKKTLESAMANA